MSRACVLVLKLVSPSAEGCRTGPPAGALGWDVGASQNNEPPAQGARSGQRFAPFLPELQTNQLERLGGSLFCGQSSEQRHLRQGSSNHCNDANDDHEQEGAEACHAQPKEKSGDVCVHPATVQLTSRTPRRLPAPRHSAGIFLEINRHAFASHFRQIEDIPIGQAHTSVRALPTDGRWLRRTVDAISRFIQSDPH